MNETALTVVEQKQISIDRLEKQLGSLEEKFLAVLPSHLSVKRLVRTVITACHNNPKLFKCDRLSLLQAVSTAATLGLEPDGVTGLGYLIPFAGKVQFIPGYKGLVQLAFNAGYIIEGVIVRENDKFSWQKGLEPRLEHIPGPGTITERGAITHAYATARHSSVPPVFNVMDMVEILRVRDASAGYKAAQRYENVTSLWEGETFDVMARKTPIRQIAKYLPVSFQRAVALEQSYDLNRNAQVIDGTVITEDLGDE